MTMLSFKQVESKYDKKEPGNEVVLGLLSFLIVWILDTVTMVLLFFQFELKMAVQAALTKKKSVNFEVFARRVSFPFKYGKVILQQSRRLKNQKIFLLPWAMVTILTLAN